MSNIKPANYTICRDFESGKITLHEAAQEFCRLGWTNFVDEKAAIRYMARAT